jgi:Undecaprenyl-phosphate glucose phosphotransferase
MIVNKRSLFYFRLLSDLLILNIAFLLSAILAQSWQILLDRYYMFFLLIALNILWIVTNLSSTFYDDFYSRNISVQLINIFRSAFIQIAATIVFIFLTKEDLFTRNFIVFYLIGLIFLVLLRVVLFRKILKALRRKGKNIRNLAIIGSGELAKKFSEMVKSNPDFGYNLIGLISEKNSSTDTPEAIGTLNDFESLIQTNKIEEVVVALNEAPANVLNSFVKICNRKAVKIHIIPDYLNYLSSRLEVSTFGEFPIITIRREPLEEIHWRILKRTFDIFFSLLITILVLSWVIPIIFILTKLNSPGPVFYVHDRFGVKNKKFKCFKFRTMHVKDSGKEAAFSPVVEDDKRVTKLGRFLRRTNLDELPQFINILLGDMSVVGPRPQPLLYYAQYEEIVEEIKLRHNVKPGLTGWAQIHGLRGDPVDENAFKVRTQKRIEYDLWYIENWTFTLDLQIIFTTVWQMLKGKTNAV